MADNVTLDPGTGGATIRTDEIAGLQYPTSKITLGDDGTDDGFVSAANPLPVSGPLTDAELRATAVPVSDGGGSLTIDGTVTANAGTGTFAVSAASLPLPSGASTAANQATGNTSLASIDGKTPALGQALAAASVPVVLTAAQLSALTPPAAITGFATESTLAALNAKATAIDTGNVTVVNEAAAGVYVRPGTSAVFAVSDGSGSLTVDDGGGSLTVDGTVAVSGSVAVTGTFWQATQPVSGTVTADAGTGTFAVSAASLPLPSGAATAAKQPALGTAGTASADVLTVQGIASMVALKTDGSAVTQPVSDAGGSLTIDAPVGTPAFVRLSDGSAAITTLPVSLASVPSHAVTNAGTFAVQVSSALPAGSNAIGKLSANSGVTIGAVEIAASQSVGVPAVATGGATPGKLISAASTNATSVKGSAGTLYSLCVFNTNAAARYLKLYDKSTAPTVGTDTPVQVFTVPGNTAGSGCVVPIPTCGLAFASGIALALTTGAADSDTGAVAASELVVSYSYK